jgi:hypothetical protein
MFFQNSLPSFHLLEYFYTYNLISSEGIMSFILETQRQSKVINVAKQAYQTSRQHYGTLSTDSAALPLWL